MHPPFPRPVRAAGPPNHRQSADHIGDHRDQSHLRIGQLAGEQLDDRRHPETDSVQPHDQCEVDQGQVPHARIGQHFFGRIPLAGLFGLLFAGQFRFEPLLLFRGQPVRVIGTVRQVEIGDDAADDCRDALQDEHPAPSRHAEPVDVVHDPGGDRGPDDVGSGQCGHEQGKRTCLLPRPKPVGNVEDDPGEKARLRHAQKKAEKVEVHGVLRPCRDDHDQPPAHDDAGDPDAGADPVHQDIAGNFKQKVPDEKDAGHETEHLGRQSQRLVHLQGGVAQVDPVQKRDDVEEKNKGDDSPHHLADGPLADGWLHGLFLLHWDSSFPLFRREPAASDRSARTGRTVGSLPRAV